MKGKTMGLLIIGLLILVVVIMEVTKEAPQQVVELKEAPQQMVEPKVNTSKEETLTITGLPYSWSEGDIMITIHEVFLADSDTKEGWVGEGYQQYKVRISYKNFAHRVTECKASVGYLRLMTDRGNLYDPKYVGGGGCYSTLDPEYSYDTHNYAFNIQNDERPTELWKYEDRSAEQPSIIFKSLH